jgi:arylsulfatase
MKAGVVFERRSRSRSRRASQAQTRPPDIVLFMTDQQRYDQVGYASEGRFETPALDRLAASGTVFESAYSGSTTCIPARVSLLTGLAAHRAPVLADGYSLREGAWTVAHELRRAGYETAVVGKMHLTPVRAEHGFDTMQMCEHFFPRDFQPDRVDQAPGFDDYHRWLAGHGLADWRAEQPGSRAVGGSGRPLFPYDERFHPTRWVADAAISVLDRRRDKPVFLIVSFPHPHEPHNPPEPYQSMYSRDDSLVPTDGFEVNLGLPPTFIEAMSTQSGPWGPTHVPSIDYLQRSLAITRGLIRHIDDAMGEVLRHVDRSNSVVFFTSDHGDYAGHRGLMRKLPWIPFDDLARVPLVVAGPEVAPGGRVRSIVQNCDFALTALDYAGVDVDQSEFDSRSLRPLLTVRPGAADVDRTILCSPNSGWPTLRRGSFKLITRTCWAEPNAALFDMDNDPGEHIDLLASPEHAEVAGELEAELRSLQWRPPVALDLDLASVRPTTVDP